MKVNRKITAVDQDFDLDDYIKAFGHFRPLLDGEKIARAMGCWRSGAVRDGARIPRRYPINRADEDDPVRVEFLNQIQANRFSPST